MFKRLQSIFTISVVAMVVAAPMVMAIPVQASGDWMSDEQVSVGNTDVDVWEQAIMPLRTDTSNADTKIDNAAWYVSHPDFGDADTLLNKSTLGVFDNDDTISVHYTGDDTTSPGSLANQDVHFVVARLTPDTETNTPNIQTVDGALDLLQSRADQDLSQDELENRLNGNVTFVHEEEAELDNSAYHEFEFNPDKSGEYVFFVAKGGMDSSGLTVENKELSITGEPTIIGLEHALVHDQSSSVELETEHAPTIGDTLEFDVKDKLDGEDVQHAVLVYDEETGFEYQEFRLDVSGDPSSLSEFASQTTFKHSIDELYGVAKIEDGTTLLGEDIPSQDRTVSPSVTELLDFIGENTDQDPTDEDFPDHESIDAPGNGILYSSATVVSGNPDDPIQVDTLTEWWPSTYRWIHIAVNEEGEIRTSSDTFELESAFYSVHEDATLEPTEITAGDSITVSGTVTNYGNTEQTKTLSLDIRPEDGEWSEISESDDITLAGGESTSFEVSGTITEPGTYDVRVHGRIVGTVTVNEADDDDDEDDDFVGGVGGDDDAPAAPPIDVDTSQQPDGSAVADISNGRAGQTVSISVPSQQATRVSGVNFESVDIELQNDDAQFSVSINSHSSRPSSVPSDPADVSVKGYLEVNTQSISDEDISQATLRFRLSSSRLSQFSSPENVVLYRYHDGAWQELETTYVGEQNGEHAFSAVTPGFSVFAIGEKQPDISVSSADLSQSAITTGESVELTAQVTNDGNGQGTYPVELTVNGEVVQTKEVTVSAGESTTVTFSYTPSEAGSYEISINDASAGTLEVSAEDQPTDTTTTTADEPDETTTTAITTTPDEDEPGEDDDGIGGSLIALLVLLVLAGVAAALYFYREEVEEAIEPYLNR